MRGFESNIHETMFVRWFLKFDFKSFMVKKKKLQDNTSLCFLVGIILRITILLDIRAA